MRSGQMLAFKAQSIGLAISCYCAFSLVFVFFKLCLKHNGCVLKAVLPPSFLYFHTASFFRTVIKALLALPIIGLHTTTF